MMAFESLDFLLDPAAFKVALAGIGTLSERETSTLVDKLSHYTGMSSSSWVTTELFKPGIRDLFMQEKIGAPNMIKKMEHFLGDQEYLFKFFFQNAIMKGSVPSVLDLLNQAINIPLFRFRLDSIDMLVELSDASIIPALYNLVTGLDMTILANKLVVERVERAMESLASLVDEQPKFTAVFRQLRLLMVQVHAW
nr:hypothetical protein [Candidatus Sigynarchaeota archaeon]